MAKQGWAGATVAEPEVERGRRFSGPWEDSLETVSGWKWGL